MPWYVFRLPVLQVARGGVETLPPLGLERVVSQAMAGQTEMVVLKMNGHLGEGLIPAYTNNSAAALGEADLQFIHRVKAARSIAGTNAIASVKALAVERPETPIFHEWLGDLQVQARNFMEACNEYGKASEYGINMISAYRQQSRCHRVIGNIPMAIDKAENAFLLNPEDPVLRHELSQLLINVGAALLAKKEYQSAGECLNRVTWLEPRNTEAMIQLSRLQLEIGQTNNAIGLLRSALKIKPDHPVAKRMLDKIGE
jgi:tetratricopeptide (TPR) repeat protein